MEFKEMVKKRNELIRDIKTEIITEIYNLIETLENYKTVIKKETEFFIFDLVFYEDDTFNLEFINKKEETKFNIVAENEDDLYNRNIEKLESCKIALKLLCGALKEDLAEEIDKLEKRKNR